MDKSKLSVLKVHGRGGLREVYQKSFDWENFYILYQWSLERGGRLREVVAQGRLTVLP